MIAITFCSSPVNAQTATIGHFEFAVPDDYTESSDNFFYCPDKGGIMFHELPVYETLFPDGTIKSFLESLIYPMAEDSHDYTITYGTLNGIEYVRYRGRDNENSELADVVMFATTKYGAAVVASEEIPEFNYILLTVRLVE